MLEQPRLLGLPLTFVEAHPQGQQRPLPPAWRCRLVKRPRRRLVEYRVAPMCRLPPCSPEHVCSNMSVVEKERGATDLPADLCSSLQSQSCLLIVTHDSCKYVLNSTVTTPFFSVI